MADPQATSATVSSVMEDPSALAIARVYADALLGTAGTDTAGLMEEFTSFLDDVLKQHPEFESLLVSGLLNRDERISLIDRVVAPFGSELFTNFLRVLARNERLDLLPLILQETWIENEKRQGKQRVRVRSAVPLSAATQETIRQQLAAALPFEPILMPEVDPALLGGIVIQIKDTVYDSSLRNRMNQLRNRLRQRSLHEIQIGRDRFSTD